MDHKLPGAGSYQAMDLITRYGTQNDRAPLGTIRTYGVQDSLGMLEVRLSGR